MAITGSYQTRYIMTHFFITNTASSLLTLTTDTSVFGVVTVMNANPTVGAAHKYGFIARALYIIKPDGTSSPTKESRGMSNCAYKLNTSYRIIM